MGVFLGLPKHLQRRSLGVPDSENDLIMCPKIIFQVVHGKHCVVHRGRTSGGLSTQNTQEHERFILSTTSSSFVLFVLGITGQNTQSLLDHHGRLWCSR